MEQMEKLFAELSDENGEYQYGLKWECTRKYDPTTHRYVETEKPEHTTFEYDGVSFWWDPKNVNHPNTPVLIASWSVQIREDDFNYYEEEVDADAESVSSFLRMVDRCGGRLEWAE